ncbi:MAG: universal stress protein [Pseudohongiellaceae bacterium]
MHSNILVIADQETGGTKALEKARDIAKAGGARVTALAFVDTEAKGESPSLGGRHSSLQESAKDIFSELPDARCDVVATPDIAAFCKRYTQEHNIDLVLKTGNRSEKLFYTPLDWRLIRELTCPVIIASANKWRPRHNVMATIDIASDNQAQRQLDEKVLHWASAWAALHQNKLHIAYCIPIAEPLSELEIVSKGEQELKKSAKMKDKIRALLEHLNVEHESILVEAGVPDRVLPSLANRVKAELVVMGSVGRKGVKGSLLGNTAEKVMHKLRTDLAVIHPD